MFECDVLLVGGGIMVLFGVFDWNGLDVILFVLNVVVVKNKNRKRLEVVIK